MDENRRNPLTSWLLRGPGHTLREQLDDGRIDMMAVMAVAPTAPLMALAMHFAVREAGAPAPHWALSAMIGLGGFGFVRPERTRDTTPAQAAAAPGRRGSSTAPHGRLRSALP
jgi:hypothetical protein